MEDFLRSAQRLANEARTRSARLELVERIRGLEAVGKIGEALRVLNAESGKLPEDLELVDFRRRLAERLDRDRADQILAEKVRHVEEALANKQSDRAGTILTELRRTHPSDPLVSRLDQRYRQQLEETRIQHEAEEIEKSLAAQNLDRAKALLDTAIKLHPSEPPFLPLQQKLDSERMIVNGVAQAKRLLEESKPDLAEDSVRFLLNLRGDHPAIRALQKEIEAARLRLKKEHQKLLSNLAGKLTNGYFEDVLAIAGRSMAQYPDDQELRTYIDRATIGIRDVQRRKPLTLANAEPLRTDPSVETAKSPSKPSIWIAAAVTILTVIAGGAVWLMHSGPPARNPPSTARKWRLSPETLSLGWQVGQRELTTAEVALIDAIPGTEFVASPENDWVSMAAQHVNAPGPLKVVVSPATLTPGRHHSRIQVKALEGGEARIVDVYLTVLPPTEKVKPAESSLQVAPSSILFRHRHGEMAPEAKTVNVLGQGVSGFRIAILLGADWVAVDRSYGLVPGILHIRPNTVSLGAGEHTGMIQLTSVQSPTVVTRIAVKIHVEAATKLPESKIPEIPPPVKPYTPGPNLPKPGPYSGDLRGNIAWRGHFSPGQRLVIGGRSVEEGGGSVEGQLPGDTAVILKVLTPGVRIETEPSPENRYSRFVLVNTGTTSLRYLQIRWEVKQ